MQLILGRPLRTMLPRLGALLVEMAAFATATGAGPGSGADTQTHTRLALEVPGTYNYE
jgi:hypothetical protein